jgi:hypothetical protein
MKKDPLPPPTANLATAIIGFWKLESREDSDASGKVHIDPFLGRDPLGILCFGGNVGVVSKHSTFARAKASLVIG